MKIPVVRGVIDRRILVNFRVDPKSGEGAAPPFRPKLVNGAGMAGVCLIRLKHIRPRFLPSFLGISSENAAHRIAVEWEQDGTAGGRLHPPAGHVFPAQHAGGRELLPRGASPCEVPGRGAGRPLPGRSGQRRPPDAPARGGARRARSCPTVDLSGRSRRRPAFFERGSLGYSVTAQARRVRRVGASQLFLAGPTAGRRTRWSPASSRTGRCSPQVRWSSIPPS